MVTALALRAPRVAALKTVWALPLQLISHRILIFITLLFFKRTLYLRILSLCRDPNETNTQSLHGDSLIGKALLTNSSLLIYY